jgi:hypothetical protein
VIVVLWENDLSVSMESVDSAGANNIYPEETEPAYLVSALQYFCAHVRSLCPLRCTSCASTKKYVLKAHDLSLLRYPTRNATLALVREGTTGLARSGAEI